MTWVILPGMDGTGELLERFSAAKAKDDVCVIVRYPRQKNLSREQLLKLIREALPPFEDYFLVAESFSGQFAIEIAAHKPKRLCGLILVNTFAEPPFTGLLRLFLFAVAPIAVRIPPPAWAIRRFLLGDAATDQDVNEVRSAISSVSPGVFSNRLKMVLRGDASPWLTHVKAPTLIIASHQDSLISPKTSKRLTSIGTASIVWLDAPHLVLMMNPQGVYSAMQAFANRIPRSGDPPSLCET